MKKLIFSLIVTTLMACGNNPTPVSDNAKQTEVPQQQPATSNAPAETAPAATNTPAAATKTVVNDPMRVILGTWTGEMNKKKLTIVMEQVAGKTLVGYNILGANKRSLKGTFRESDWDQPCAKAYQVVLSEPGDGEWDGVFTLKFVGYEDQQETENGPDCAGNLKGVEAYGEWKSNNGKKHHKDIHLDKSK